MPNSLDVFQLDSSTDIEDLYISNNSLCFGEEEEEEEESSPEDGGENPSEEWEQKPNPNQDEGKDQDPEDSGEDQDPEEDETKGKVPYERFKEVNSKMRQFEQQMQERDQLIDAIFEQFPEVKQSLMSGQQPAGNASSSQQDDEPVKFKDPSEYKDMSELAEDITKYVQAKMQKEQTEKQRFAQTREQAARQQLDEIKSTFGEDVEGFDQFIDFAKKLASTTDNVDLIQAHELFMSDIYMKQDGESANKKRNKAVNKKQQPTVSRNELDKITSKDISSNDFSSLAAGALAALTGK